MCSEVGYEEGLRPGRMELSTSNNASVGVPQIVGGHDHEVGNVGFILSFVQW